MVAEDDIELFLSGYSDYVYRTAQQLRKAIIQTLPGITEQIDMAAKMIAYCYGPKYVELICVIIPSKGGLKLGFNRGNILADRFKDLEGDGKISRYIAFKINDSMDVDAVTELVLAAQKLYQETILYK